MVVMYLSVVLVVASGKGVCDASGSIEYSVESVVVPPDLRATCFIVQIIRNVSDEGGNYLV